VGNVTVAVATAGAFVSVGDSDFVAVLGNRADDDISHSIQLLPASDCSRSGALGPLVLIVCDVL
jgi:hypothetical protein